MKQQHEPLALYGCRRIVITLLTAVLATAHAESVDDVVAHTYSQRYQVSPPEAQRRLTLARQAGLLGQRLERERPGTFAGLYVEHQPEFRVIAQFTSNARAELAAYTDNPIYIARSAPRSIALLLAVNRDIAEQLQQAGLEFESALDIKSSEVNVYVRDPELALQRLPQRLSAMGFVKFHTTTGFPQTTSPAQSAD